MTFSEIIKMNKIKNRLVGGQGEKWWIWLWVRLVWRIHRISNRQLNFTVWKKVKVKVAKLCPTLWNPMDCSPPGSSVHGILQARMLEWVVMPSSRRSSLSGINPKSLASQAGSLPSEPPRKCEVGYKKWRSKQSLGEQETVEEAHYGRQS